MQRARPPTYRLLLLLAPPDQRRRKRYRLLPRGPARVLHPVPGHQHQVLSEPLLGALLAASAIAGLSTLFSP